MKGRPIPGYSRHSCDTLGNVYGPKGPMKLRPNRDGYIIVSVYSDEAKKHTGRAVHRLVAMTFIGPIAKGMWVNHKDGVRSNNTLENLEITTPSENHLHARDVLKRKYAYRSGNGNARLSDESVEAIRHLLAEGWPHWKIAKAFNISGAQVSHIRTGKQWGSCLTAERIETNVNK